MPSSTTSPCVASKAPGLMGYAAATLAKTRPLRYSINITLDGCCDHRAIPADDDLHRHAAAILDEADALLVGRVTYELMESAWRPPTPTGSRPDWMEPFAPTITAARKYVVSGALEQVDWNAELVCGVLGKSVEQLKRESGNGLLVGGVKLPLALTELGLIDEYEFVVQPRLAGQGPTLVRGAVEACRLEAREPAGAWLRGSGDAVRAEKLAVGLANPSRSRQGLRPLVPHLSPRFPLPPGKCERASFRPAPTVRVMTSDEFVPVGFEPPTSLVTAQFHLEPLGPQHNEADHAAWMSSIEHIRSTPSYRDGTWPPRNGMTLGDNLTDLRRHADDFARGTGFTFTVLDPTDHDVIGCVYLYPSASEQWDVTVQSWVRADVSNLDGPLADAVARWLATDWPWKRVDRCGR